MPREILIVEDNDDLRSAFESLLRGEGYTVNSFATAEAALEHCTKFGVEVAVLDVRLPGRSGDDLGAEIRRCWPEARIIFMTAEMSIDRLKAAVSGCFVVRKPPDLDVLLALLKAD